MSRNGLNIKGPVKVTIVIENDKSTFTRVIPIADEVKLVDEFDSEVQTSLDSTLSFMPILDGDTFFIDSEVSKVREPELALLVGFDNLKEICERTRLFPSYVVSRFEQWVVFSNTNKKAYTFCSSEEFAENYKTVDFNNGVRRKVVLKADGPEPEPKKTVYGIQVTGVKYFYEAWTRSEAVLFFYTKYRSFATYDSVDDCVKEYKEI